MQDLALQVALVDVVHVDDAERADAGGSQVERGGRSEAAGAEQQHLGLEQLDLPGHPDLGQEEVALVAIGLDGAERRRLAPGAPLVLPLAEAAGHRHDVGVAELAERPGGERAADPAGAVDDDRLRLVGEATLDLALEMATGDVHRARQGTLFVLVGLAHVEDHDLAAFDELLGLRRVDFGDLRLGLDEQVAERRHERNATHLIGYHIAPGAQTRESHVRLPEGSRLAPTPSACPVRSPSPPTTPHTSGASSPPTRSPSRRTSPSRPRRWSCDPGSTRSSTLSGTTRARCTPRTSGSASSGPTALWLVRRLVSGLEHYPDGFELDMEETARALGLGYTSGKAGPFLKALDRCSLFGLTRPVDDGLGVRRKLVPLPRRLIDRLPPHLQAAHAEWTPVRQQPDELMLARATAIARVLLGGGDEPEVAEHHLLAIGVPPRLAALALHRCEPCADDIRPA